MTENYSLKELNEWADKVIDCISKWADEMNKAFNGTPTSIKIEKIDFSEHDKVFEDKIAKLEKELEEWKEEARAVKKHRDEQLKSFRKGIEPYVDLLHMHETIAELKQRIAELESEKSEKLTKHTEVIVAREINGQEYVRLEDFASVVNDLQAEIGT